MALRQRDALEYRTAKCQLVTVNQLIDNASRCWISCISTPLERPGCKVALIRAINEYGAPQEVLSDNFRAFNQLGSGTFGSVEIFPASKGSMPITGLPRRPTAQGKNERSHRTLKRFPTANKPQDLTEVQSLFKLFKEHYNKWRPHRSLNQTTRQAV